MITIEPVNFVKWQEFTLKNSKTRKCSETIDWFPLCIHRTRGGYAG